MRQSDSESAAGGVSRGHALRDLQATGRAPLSRIWLFSLVAIAVLAIDVTTKVLVVASLVDHRPVKLFDGLVYLVHTRNTGAAFSLASSFTVLLSLLAVAVVIFIIRVASRLTSRWWAVTLGLILGGATGNLVDRLFRHPGPFRGGVVDFISLFDPVNPPWPVFNLADSALVIGVIMAVILELRGHHISGRSDR